MIDSGSDMGSGLYGLVELIRFLRSEKGCPWDRQQTHESIRRNFIEEAYEAAEAIDEEDPAHLKEELGDVLLQVVFHSLMEEEKGGWTIDDVADEESLKMKERHPHLFGDESSARVKDWEELKREQRGQIRTSEAMAGVSRAIPALWRSEKILKKAFGDGFCWPDAASSLKKLREETDELEAAVTSGEAVEEELGDVLFAAAGTAALVGIDPERALLRAGNKFIQRYGLMEEKAAKTGNTISELSLDEKLALWGEAKLILEQKGKI